MRTGIAMPWQTVRTNECKCTLIKFVFAIKITIPTELVASLPDEAPPGAKKIFALELVSPARKLQVAARKWLHFDIIRMMMKPHNTPWVITDSRVSVSRMKKLIASYLVEPVKI